MILPKPTLWCKIERRFMRESERRAIVELLEGAKLHLWNGKTLDPSKTQFICCAADKALADIPLTARYHDFQRLRVIIDRRLGTWGDFKHWFMNQPENMWRYRDTKFGEDLWILVQTARLAWIDALIEEYKP